MGTEVSFPIGTILTRREPLGDDRDVIKVIGAGKQIVATSNTHFGESWNLDPNVARREYTTDTTGTEVIINAPTYIDPGPTPEQVFAEMAREQPKKVEDLSIVDPEPKPVRRGRGQTK